MKPVTTFVIVLLALIAVAQLLRFVLGWVVIVNGLVVPVWASAVACLVAATLSVMLWRENRR